MNIEINLKSGKRSIGENFPTFIIAEAGSNHDQKIEQAKQLIDVAVASKADAVKFQLFKAEVLVGKKHAAFDAVKKAEMPREWLDELVEYCDRKGILFMATPFDHEAVDLLCKIETPVIKWASSETTNLPLLAYVASKKKPIFLSTGMCDLADVQNAITVLNRTGMDDIVLLQCVSNYPTEPKDVNLRVMDTFKQAFGYPVGFSDHTLGTAISLAAVARGACVIEKHFTLSRKLTGPDHSYAIEPNELTSLVKQVREVEMSLGTPLKGLHALEVQYGRREGLYAGKDFQEGAALDSSEVEISRPAHGIRARFKGVLEGARMKRAVAKGKAIQWEDLVWPSRKNDSSG